MTGRRHRVAAVAAFFVAACGGTQPPEATGPLRATERVRGPVRFAVVGDFGTGEEEELAVAAALRRVAIERRIRILVTTGDNIYEDGHPEDFQAAWEEPYGWTSRRGLDVVASLGNHDVRTDGGAPVMGLFDMPNRWYARRYGPIEFFILDGNALGEPEQLRFVASAMRRSRAPWKIAVVHQSPYGCSRHGGDAVVRELAVPVLRAGGADVVLSGHEHNYQRFAPLDGITFVVSGGGGADLHAVEECPDDTPEPVAAVDETHHFLVGTATPERLRLVAITADGEVADRFTI